MSMTERECVTSVVKYLLGYSKSPLLYLACLFVLRVKKLLCS